MYVVMCIRFPSFCWLYNVPQYSPISGYWVTVVCNASLSIDVCCGCPGTVCTLISILLPREGLPLMRSRSHTQVISLNLHPILTGRIKARANRWLDNGWEKWDWRSQRRERERDRGWGGGRRMEQNHMSWRSCKRGLIAEKQISVVIDLGIRLTNIITVVCFLYGLIGVRNYHNRCTSIAQAPTIVSSMCI